MRQVEFSCRVHVLADVQGSSRARRTLVREVWPSTGIDYSLHPGEAIVKVLRQLTIFILKVVLALDYVEITVALNQCTLLDPGQPDRYIELHSDLEVDVE